MSPSAEQHVITLLGAHAADFQRLAADFHRPYAQRRMLEILRTFTPERRAAIQEALQSKATYAAFARRTGR